MRFRFALTLLLLTLLLSRCTKEPLNGTHFAGNWKCDSYTYVYWNGPDSSYTTSTEMDQPCYLHIEPGSDSQFYMGIGTAGLPLVLSPDENEEYAESVPQFFDGPFAIQRGGDNQDGVNNWDIMESTVEFGDERQLRATCTFKLISENQMNVHVLLRMTTGLTHKYTYAQLELSK